MSRGANQTRIITSHVLAAIGSMFGLGFSWLAFNHKAVSSSGISIS